MSSSDLHSTNSLHTYSWSPFYAVTVFRFRFVSTLFNHWSSFCTWLDWREFDKVLRFFFFFLGSLACTLLWSLCSAGATNSLSMIPSTSSALFSLLLIGRKSSAYNRTSNSYCARRSTLSLSAAKSGLKISFNLEVLNGSLASGFNWETLSTLRDSSSLSCNYNY